MFLRWGHARAMWLPTTHLHSESHPHTVTTVTLYHSGVVGTRPRRGPSSPSPQLLLQSLYDTATY